MTELLSQTPGDQTYRVAARKYRPKTFDALIGQEAMVKVLTNAITLGRLPHAILLTGTRGVGKTTTARLLARALNCVGTDGQSGPTLSPCGICSSCVAIDQDAHLDVIEMDAASRTGVDDVREVIEASRYKAVSARYKIYIIDEVHMLSKSAFNALLKTLEEPPPHVKFIFATTEIRRVPETVLSRCMRFDLRRVDIPVLMEHLQKISSLEEASIEPEALALLARAAAGSVRDGMSLLDQAITLSEKKITRQSVQGMLGLVDQSSLLNLYEGIIKGDAGLCLKMFQSFYGDGADPVLLIEDLMSLTHTLHALKVAPETLKDPRFSGEEMERLKNWTAQLSVPMLSRLWQGLLKGLEEMKQAPNAEMAGEMVLIRLCYLQNLPTPSEVIQQLVKMPESANANAQTQIVSELSIAQEVPSSPMIKAALAAFPGAKIESLA